MHPLVRHGVAESGEALAPVSIFAHKQTYIVQNLSALGKGQNHQSDPLLCNIGEPGQVNVFPGPDGVIFTDCRS